MKIDPTNYIIILNNIMIIIASTKLKDETNSLRKGF